MRPESISRWDREIALLAALAAVLGAVAFFISLRRGDLLLYGDAGAHINIARRVFDSRTPGLLQLGTVWLPLPHLLMVPFLFSARAWQSGAGGSVPSVIAYILSVIGLFRLVRDALSVHAQPDAGVRLAAWLAALTFALNPNLLYLQSTAMTEPLYLAWFIWAVVFFAEFARLCVRPEEELLKSAARSLMKSGLCLAGAALTRYDGWFLAAMMIAAGWLAVFRDRGVSYSLRRGWRRFVLLAVLMPVLWMLYNAAVYRNPLEFADGPYSARAIEARSTAVTHPGAGNLATAAIYFLKSAELNLAQGNWPRLWIALAAFGSLVTILFDRRLAPLLLLWTPLLFYAFSVAYAGVPIYVPDWWPFSFYNVRYGLQLLPACAVFVALAIYFVVGLLRNVAAELLIALAVAVFVSVSYVSVLRAQPVCWREAFLNSRGRIVLEHDLADALRQLPAGSTLLMYAGDHAAALQQAGIPFRNTINEGNHRTWKHPDDPQGLWERALADPAQYADFAVAVASDPVDRALQGRSFPRVRRVDVPGQAPAVIYRLR
jgi:hypothetical protein